MTKCIYVINTPVVALTAATARSVIGIARGAPVSTLPDLASMAVSFDGVTASAVPVLIEICESTFATNYPGTNSTTLTPVQAGGRITTGTGFDAAHSWTVEPTVLTVLKEYIVTPNAGIVRDWFFEGIDSPGAVIRCTAPANVNVRVSVQFHRA